MPKLQLRNCIRRERVITEPLFTLAVEIMKYLPKEPQPSEYLYANLGITKRNMCKALML
jgi:hypothetical protein